MQPPTMMDGTPVWIPSPADSVPPAPSQTHAWKDGGSFSFHDILDLLNPLQHIPLVSTLYRWITGDNPGNVARVVGDGLYGGPIGAASGLFNIAFKEESGKDVGEMAVAMVTGDDKGEVKIGTATTPPLPTDAAPATAPAPASAPAVVTGPTPITVATVAPNAPMPLLKSPARPAASAMPTPAAMGPAEQSFIDQNSALQRSIYGHRAISQDRPATAPIPLHITGPALPARTPRPLVAPPLTRSPVQPGATVAPIPMSALPDNSPVDISQRMMEALDKYARLQQQRGQLIDVSP
jgi:hypothetical protein